MPPTDFVLRCGSADRVILGSDGLRGALHSTENQQLGGVNSDGLCFPRSAVSDHHGHGTGMAGPALHGDLTTALASQAPNVVPHRPESAKILPPDGQNAPQGVRAPTVIPSGVDTTKV